MRSRKRHPWLMPIARFGATLALILGAIGCADQGSSGAPAPRSTSRPAAMVEVAQVRSAPLSQRIPIVGTAYAAEEATISTKTAGILRRVFLDVGEVAEPGTSLAQVDRVDYEVAVQQAEAALSEALARLGVTSVPDESFDLNTVSTVSRATAQLESAKFSYERLQRLSSGGMAPVTEQEVNDSLTALRVAEANQRLAIDEAAALVATSRERQAQLRMAMQRLSNTLTLAPPIPTTLGGSTADEWVVSARLVTEGQYLEVANPLYRLIIRDPLKLRCKVPERYAAIVRVGQAVRLNVIEGVTAPEGKIARISPAVDPTNRTFEIEALVDNAAGALMPGAFVTGEIVADDNIPRLLIPAQSVIISGGDRRVFVVENNKAIRRNVQTGRESDGVIEIVTGLSEGELVISNGLAGVSDGAEVQTATKDARN